VISYRWMIPFELYPQILYVTANDCCRQFDRGWRMVIVGVAGNLIYTIPAASEKS